MTLWSMLACGHPARTGDGCKLCPDVARTVARAADRIGKLQSGALSFVVLGEPVPKGRAKSRTVVKGDGKSFVAHYTPEETRAYEKKVKETCRYAANLMRWTWKKADRFRVVVGVYRTHEGAGGDADNYGKAALDAINKVAFLDDRYVRDFGVRLRQDALRPRLEITVTKVRMEAT